MRILCYFGFHPRHYWDTPRGSIVRVLRCAACGYCIRAEFIRAPQRTDPNWMQPW